MLGLEAFRRKARQFEYKPRYYDAEKEAREQRRRELLGEDAWEAPSPDKPYKPGAYIRDNMRQRRGMSTSMSQVREKRDRTIRRAIIALVLLVCAVIFLLKF